MKPLAAGAVVALALAAGCWALLETVHSRGERTRAAPARTAKPYRVVGVQGVMRFAVLSPEAAASREEVELVAANICGDDEICIVHFWLDADLAARGLPMSDQQVNTTVAVYGRNRNTSRDGLTCHPFGEPGSRCAKVD